MTGRVVRRADQKTERPRHHLLRQRIATWELLREHLQDQVAIGRYPTGSWLPSVRVLARELKINRNTVSKVYQALGRDGLLETVRGRGVRVVRAGVRGTSPEARLVSESEALIRNAYVNRIDRDWLVNRFASIARDVYASLSVRVGFVECSEHESTVLARDLSEHLATEVDPIVLSDVIADPAAYASRYDVLATTFFHLQEVNAAIESGGIEVVGMNHAPSHETVLEIARLEPSITIAVVAQNERTLKLVQTIVEMYSRGRIISAITTDREGFQRALREADVTVVHALAHEEVLRIKPRTVTVTVKFQIEQQSIEFLRDAVVRRRDVFSATV